MKPNTLIKNPGLAAISSALLLFSPAVLAHSGHGAMQSESISGILHLLTAHPLMLGTVGLVFFIAVLHASRSNINR